MANSKAADLRRSPLHDSAEHLADKAVTGERDVAVREIPLLTMIGIRAIPGTPAHDNIGKAIGVGLPDKVGQVTGSAADTTAVLWISPDEFLAITDEEDLQAKLEDALGEDRGHVTELTGNRTTIEVSGTAARDLLRKACPTDLHDRSFPVNQAITSTYARVPILLWRTGDDTWRLLPRASFAQHIADWLLDGMNEFRQAPIA